MISLENAKRLRELGLEPGDPDAQYWEQAYPLSQLLEEVEEQGYNWHAWCSDPTKRKQANKKYCYSPFYWKLDEKKDMWIPSHLVGADSDNSIEDAVALALITMLENEGSE